MARRRLLTGDERRRLFETPRYPELDADFQNLLSYAGAELAVDDDAPPGGA